VNAAVAERVVALEVERAQPTPRRPKPDLNAPDTPQQQAARRAVLLAALRGNA
jgi:hypothetical protein